MVHWWILLKLFEQSIFGAIVLGGCLNKNQDG